MNGLLSGWPYDRRSREFWINRIAAYKKSELPVEEFCRRQDISCSSFKTWSRRLGEELSPPQSHGGGFIRAVVEGGEFSKECDTGDSASSESFEVSLPSGLSLVVFKGFDEVTLRRLLKVMVSVNV